jgi:hypothetical protein
MATLINHDVWNRRAAFIGCLPREENTQVPSLCGFRILAGDIEANPLGRLGKRVCTIQSSFEIFALLRMLTMENPHWPIA